VKISLFDAVNDKQELRAYMIKGYEDGADAFISWMTKTKALLCFCPDPTDDDMWNRYGGKHAGEGSAGRRQINARREVASGVPEFRWFR
jgi:hypothetical protein